MMTSRMDRLENMHTRQMKKKAPGRGEDEGDNEAQKEEREKLSDNHGPQHDDFKLVGIQGRWLMAGARMVNTTIASPVGCCPTYRCGLALPSAPGRGHSTTLCRQGSQLVRGGDGGHGRDDDDGRNDHGHGDQHVKHQDEEPDKMMKV
jgi:hypothetical protein